MKISACVRTATFQKVTFFSWLSELTKIHFSFSLALPDLVLDTDLLKSHMEMNMLPLFSLRCAMEENCLASSAARQLR